MPVHAGNTLARLHKERGRLELKLRRPATLGELAAEMDMPEDKVAEALIFATAPLSLAEPTGADSNAEFGDLIEDDSGLSPLDAAMLAFLPKDVATLLGSLDERERRIISLRFGFDRGEPRTLEEVGEHFNLGRERIRQIEAQAMSKLRRPTYAATARSLLEA